MFITVAICTWNRASLLDQTLTRLRELRVPAGVNWELLVVNNNCTDDTKAVLERHASHLPLRELLETRQGHSFARNCAIAAASGDFLIWTDDDVLVEPDWLEAYANAFRAWPDAGIFGGTVLPWFSVEPPAWFRRHQKVFESILMLTEHGPDVRPLRPDEGLAGASFAFPTDLLRRNPFNTELGRVKGRLTGADDTEMVKRLRSQGAQAVWVGNARLLHNIPADRLTVRFFRNYFIGAGRTHVRQHGMPPGRCVLGVPMWAVTGWCVQQARALLFSPFGGPRWLAAFRQANIYRGVIQEARERRAASLEQPANPTESAAPPLAGPVLEEPECCQR